VFDIDDTLIDGQNAAIPDMLQMYTELLKNGFKIYLVTARTYSLKNIEKTKNHLVNAGFITFHGLFLMPKKFLGRVASFKSELRKRIQSFFGGRLVGLAGNCWHDVMHPKLISKMIGDDALSTLVLIAFDGTVVLKLPRHFKKKIGERKQGIS